MSTWEKYIVPMSLFLLVWVGLSLLPDPGQATAYLAVTNTPTQPAPATDTPTPPSATDTPTAQPGPTDTPTPQLPTDTPTSQPPTATPTGAVSTPNTPQPPRSTPVPATDTPIPTPEEIPGLGAGPGQMSIALGGVVLLAAVLLLTLGWYKIWRLLREG